MVSIIPFFQNAGFDSHATKAMGKAFDAACRDKNGNSNDVVREVIAKRILDAAATGERDPERLCSVALSGLRIERHSA